MLANITTRTPRSPKPDKPLVIGTPAAQVGCDLDRTPDHHGSTAVDFDGTAENVERSETRNRRCWPRDRCTVVGLDPS